MQTYAIGVGRDGFELKMGQTKIVRKKEKPTWYPTESTLRDKPWVGTVVPPGPDNPLGEYALYLGWPTYLIHGTNKPYGVGRRVSRGCIRMYPARGGAAVSREIPVGTTVTAVDQLVKARLASGRAVSRGAARLRTRSTSSRRPRRSRPRRSTPEDRQLIVDRAGPDGYRIDWAVAEAELIAPARHAGPDHRAPAAVAGNAPWRRRRRRAAPAAASGAAPGGTSGIY